MKVVLATYGSRGDVQPMLALALHLMKAGHDTLLIAPPENTSWVEGFGVPFHPIGASLKGVLSQATGLSLKDFLALSKAIKQQIPIQFSQLPDLLAGADLVLGASLMFAAPSVAEALALPLRSVGFCPQVLPSAEHPPIFQKRHWLPRPINRLLWLLNLKLDLLGFQKVVNEGRAGLGLKPVRELWGHMLEPGTIMACDTALAPVPADVRCDYFQIGYWHLPADGCLNQEILEFLDQGPPPIYIGFGSMPESDPSTLTKLIVQAARISGQRVVISQGWGHLGMEKSGPDFLIVDDVPHQLLFPRLAAVVHHGGAGTTATAALAGVPQVIIPHVLDQYYWAHRVYKSGLGPKPIDHNRLTPERLARDIRECIADDTFRRQAGRVAEMIRRQDSLAITLKHLEEIVRRSKTRTIERRQ